jgi:hypothetical protein
VWILDEHGEVLPIGVPGEIYIAGTGVALGYHNQADETTRRFLPDRFSKRPEDLMYRTGDVGRWCGNGQLQHLGRNDFQVKVRGYRIELEEIEAALARHRDVEQAVVVTASAGEAEARLVAYVVGRDGAQPPGSELRAHLRTELPDYMVPSAFICLPRMPLTLNGKVDRQSLPALSGCEVSRGPISLQSPRTATEATVAEVWRQLLGVTTVAVSDNFLDLGGHSLLIMRAVAMLESQLRVRLSPRAFIFQSLEQIAAELERLLEPAKRPVNAVQPEARSAGGRLIERILKALSRP